MGGPHAHPGRLALCHACLEALNASMIPCFEYIYNRTPTAKFVHQQLEWLGAARHHTAATDTGSLQSPFPGLSRLNRSANTLKNTKASYMQTQRLSKRQQTHFGPSPAPYWRQWPPFLYLKLKIVLLFVNHSLSRNATPSLRLLHTTSSVLAVPKPPALKDAWSCQGPMHSA